MEVHFVSVASYKALTQILNVKHTSGKLSMAFYLYIVYKSEILRLI